MPDASMGGQLEPGTRLEVLHEHYKSSVEIVHGREASRNRQFWYVVIAILGLFFEVSHAEQTQQALETWLGGIIGGTLSLPPAVFVAGVRVAVLLLLLQYFSNTKHIDRSYLYIKDLESKLGMLGGIPNVKGEYPWFSREGYAYSDGYPLTSWVAYWSYTLVFPVFALAGVVTSAVAGVNRDLYIWQWTAVHIALSSGAALVIVVFLFDAHSAAIKKCFGGAPTGQ